MVCKVFTPWLEKLLQFVKIFRYWLSEVWQIFCVQIMLKKGFYQEK